ncbi:hypothetical protein JCM19233_4690 [Vibrio astriarenae]|nr:hypothetical protein JCM19233_4690 [Vibrio sp. C7]
MQFAQDAGAVLQAERVQERVNRDAQRLTSLADIEAAKLIET